MSAFYSGIGDRGECLDTGKVLRCEPRVSPFDADVLQVDGCLGYNGKRQGGSQDLPSSFSDGGI